MFWSLLSALTLLLLVITVAPTVVSGKRLIVQLSVPPLVKHPEYAQLRQQQHHNAAIDALFLLFKEHVRSQQDAFLASLPKHWQVALLKTEKGMMPARVHRLLNAITIRVPDAEAKYAMRIIRLLPGVVAVTEDHRYKLLLHSSRSAIGAFDAWRDLNSTELNAGAGVKVAVMDSGIYTKNAMFSDTGMAYPADGSNISYPQGEASNCNKKVIVSRMYIDPDNLPVSSDRHSYPSLLSSTHGTHCASTVGGALTATSNAGVKLNITGVAPGAWLMNYRIFFRDNSGNTVATSDSQILQAFDDIVADGADVASNSWGSFPFYSSGTPIDIAVRALTDAGVFVVFAAGNDGPTTLTIERYSPALRVGATSSGGRLGSSVMKTTPPLGINVEFLNSGATARSPSGTYTLHAPEDGNELGCSPFKSSFNASENVAVVVLRGTCTFVDKIKNVADAGAKLAIVGNSREGGPELVNMAVTGATINAVSVGHEPALMLINLTKKEAAPSVTLETLSTKTVVSYEADM